MKDFEIEMTKHIPSPVPFEISITAHYAVRVLNQDPEMFSLRPLEAEYKRLPGTHYEFINFLSISRALENAAREYNAKWAIENVRKEKVQERGLIEYVPHLDGAYSDLLYQVGTLTSTTVAAIGIMKVIQPILVQWLKNQGLKMLRVKIGTTEISVQGKHDIDKVLQLLKKVASDNPQERPKTLKKRAGRSKKQPTLPKAKRRRRTVG